MTAPRWQVFRDVFSRPGRSLLAVLAMAAGVFQIGAMLYKHALLQPELETMYGKTRPASATLVLDRVSDALVDSVRRVPGVAAAEARPVIMARVRTGEDEWLPAILHVVRDFDRQQMDKFVKNDGAWPPGDGEVLLERSALQLEGIGKRGSLDLRLGGGEERTLRVAGTVHAAGLPPAWMDHFVPGFVTWNSSVRGSERGESAQIRIVTVHPLDEGFIRETADSVRAMLERQGHAVTRVDVPAPGRHPHADQMEAFLYLLLSFGILSFALSTVLVAGMIHALMAEEVKQVGVMKAIGATSGQIAGIYLGQVSLLAGASVAIGIPLGILAGGAYARFAAGILNADVSRTPFPAGLIVAVALGGMLLPLLVALGPVLRASRITVHEALHGDVSPRHFGARAMDRWLTRLAWLPRPLALSLRSTFVRRTRLALTVATLAVGGAVFMSALNVSAAWTRAVNADFRNRRFDLTVMLSEPQSIADMNALLATVPGVERAEYWAGANPFLIGPTGVAGGAVALVGPEPASTLLDLPLVAGRWLSADDGHGAVINRAVQARNPALAVGDSVRVRLAGRTVAFRVVGVVSELSPHPIVYAPKGAVLAATGQPGSRARTIRVVTTRKGDAGQREAARAIERTMAERGIEVSGLQRMEDAKQAILDHLVIIMAILTMAALIVVLVGGIGLTSTLMLDVIRRTREIGILGAIGATPATIARHVWIEAVLIGVLSWILSILVAAPISYVLEASVGRIFFRSPLEFHMSPAAAAMWLALVIVLASASSFYPARRAARLTVRDALSHV